MTLLPKFKFCDAKFYFSSKSSSIPQMFFTFAIKHLILEFLKTIWRGVQKNLKNILIISLTVILQRTARLQK